MKGIQIGFGDRTGRKALLRSTTAILCACTVATAAQAQSTAPADVAPAAAAAPDPTAINSAGATEAAQTGLGDIVVTASKRSENLQRAALSVTAVNAAAIEARGITDASQLVALAPSVQFQPSFLLLTYIRGVGNYSSQPAVDQSVAYNVDGIYVDRPYAMPNALFDLERIELLRGPQGTLQGRNSTGGSVNLITARPTDEFQAKVAFSAGNYSLLTTEGMINVPLSPDVAVRLSAASTDHDGYFKNGFGDANTLGVRARVLAKPTSRLEILVTAEYSRRNEKGPTDSPCPPGSTDAACAGVKWDPFDGVPGQGTDPVLSIDEENYLTAKNYALYAEVNYDLDFATLTYVPSYRYHEYRSNQSYSHAFGFYPAVNDGMFSQELRLTSKSSSPLNWVVGAYYGRQKSREQNYFLRGDGPFITVTDPHFPTIGHVYFKNDVDRYVYRSQSVFAQVAVPVLVDGLRVVAGGRYTMDKKTLSGNTGIAAEDENGESILVSADVGGKQSLHRFTYKAGIEYDIAPSILGYANVSTGFKSGGVNAVPAGSDLPATFGPEKNMAYQAGIKSRFFDNRVQINAEGFYYDYSGYLTSAFASTDAGVLIPLNINSQKARMYGGEVEASILATEQDRIDLSLSLLSAKYKEFVIAATGVDLSGKRMQNAPGHTFTAGYGHTFDLASGATIIAHGDAHYESNQYVDYRLSPGSLVKGFWRESVDVTYHSADDRWSLGAFVRNISNNGSPTTAVGGLGPYELAVPLPPRTFGARASAKF